MLKLCRITKDYQVADTTVHALKGVDLTFRKNEFVSILGPSGCGKTTMLNIIGGLDHYTDGELFINGVSTKSYTDRDWDNYRNHSIGFVFQSYNLIPHQTISENVELALSISGVDKAERIRRAHEALDKVGLKGQYNKKPNQLSGGQCQRVAIARALVNEPEILLADEPTGALDTATSVQIMEIIKEIAAERLVIMVTHNPELAEQYSTRIINLLDGEVVHDSDPFDENEDNKQQLGQTESTCDASEQDVQQTLQAETKSDKVKKQKKSKLSVSGAFKLSARNLWSKLKRTILVCIAGSIGIVGVATVLGVSSGVKGYIASMQDDMLSGNPITVSAEAMNFEAITNAMNNIMSTDGNDSPEIIKGLVNVDKMVEYLVSRGNDMANVVYTNKITQTYVDFVDQMPKEFYSALLKRYGVNMSNNLYTDFKMVDGTKNMSLSAANTLYSKMLSKTEYAQFSAYISMFTESFRIAPNNSDYILSQYDILGEGGKIATEANEIMIVVDSKTSLTDLLLAQFGYFSQDEFVNLVENAVDPENTPATYRDRLSYEDLLGKTFTWYPNDDVYNKHSLGEFTRFTYNPAVEEMDRKDGAIELKITAILRPKETINYGALKAGFYYTDKLMEEVLRSSKTSQIVDYLNETKQNGFSIKINANSNPSIADLLKCVTYTYTLAMRNADVEGGIEYFEENGIVGSMDTMSAMMSAMLNNGNAEMEYTLSKRDLGGDDIPSTIAIYPLSFNDKNLVTNYLNRWNGSETLRINGADVTADERENIMYTDTLEIVIGMINQFIDIITVALIAFTALSLVVSTVMIAIITYVSVIERIKEIGVIRSLGGRKRDVSNLFIAETFIIGGVSGLIGILLTYGISLILNLILGSAFGIYTIAALPIWQALIMIGVSIVLTLISGLVPANLAAKKDPVESLRSE